MSTKVLLGEAIAPGFAVGQLHAFGYRVQREDLPDKTIKNPNSEIDRFQKQVAALEQDIAATVSRLEADSLTAEAEIMRCHLLILKDPDLKRQVLEIIRDTHHGAEVAVIRVFEQMSAMLELSKNPILAERAADFRDLAMRLAYKLESESQLDLDGELEKSESSVLAMPELLPSVVLEAKQLGIVGFIVASGTTVSHGAILAKSLGIPAVRVPMLEVMKSFAKRTVLVWGGGEVLVEPTDAELKTRSPVKEVATGRPPGVSWARVWLSIVDPDQLATVDWDGIEGVGLYRSEALFMRHREDFPTEYEQYIAYRRLFRLAGTRPVIFRTADLGADKPVEHMRLGPQENPYLGLRAHRLFRFHPEIFITQIRAVLRAAHGDHQLRLMFPMLESIDQLRFLRQMIGQAVESLEEEGVSFQRDFRQGVLVETPSAVWDFRRLIRETDFASVGTNDLVQYLFAVERNAANVADLYQPEHPIVLQVIKSLAQLADDHRKSLSICGEMASDTSIIPVLVGLGIREFSVAPGAANEVNRSLSSINRDQCTQLATQCLNAETLTDVRVLLGRASKSNSAAQTASEVDVLDPICGMIVSPSNTPYALRIGGIAHHFCSRSCLNRFINTGGDSGSKRHHDMICNSNNE